MRFRSIPALLLALLPAASPATAAPARPSGDDLARLLAGAAALYVIGRAVSKSRADDHDRKKDKEKKRKHDDRNWDRGRDHDRGYRDYDRGHRGWDHRGHGRGVRALPAECLARYETRRGDVRAFSRNCLKREYRGTARLPDACRTTIRTRNGLRDVYGPRCLAGAGYRLAGR